MEGGGRDRLLLRVKTVHKGLVTLCHSCGQGVTGLPPYDPAESLRTDRVMLHYGRQPTQLMPLTRRLHLANWSSLCLLRWPSVRED